MYNLVTSDTVLRVPRKNNSYLRERHYFSLTKTLSRGLCGTEYESLQETPREKKSVKEEGAVSGTAELLTPQFIPTMGNISI